MRPEKWLVLLLRIGAVLTLSALGAVVMPHAWMSAIHAAMGLGPLPDGPMIGYLTRSLSAMYAVHGAIVLYVSFDVRRYRPAIRFFGLVFVVFGAVLLAIDIGVGLPLYWILSEGPFIMPLGLVIWWLGGKCKEP